MPLGNIHLQTAIVFLQVMAKIKARIDMIVRRDLPAERIEKAVTDLFAVMEKLTEADDSAPRGRPSLQRKQRDRQKSRRPTVSRATVYRTSERVVAEGYESEEKKGGESSNARGNRRSGPR